MRKASLLFAAALVALVAGPAFGSINVQVGDTFTPVPLGTGDSTTLAYASVVGYNNGGPFLLTDNTLGGNQEIVYCVAAGSGDQTFNPYEPYYIAGTSSPTTTNNGNTVNATAEYIYYEAVTNNGSTTGTAGSLLTSNATIISAWQAMYGSAPLVITDPNFQTEIQEAIWNGVTNSSNQPLGTLYDPVAVAIYNAFVPPPNISGDVQVMVFNPNYPDGTPAQSQLFLDLTLNSSGSPAVPEPATIAIWGLGAGLAGAAALRRRKQPKGRWSEENRQAIFQVIERRR